jgi:curli production assembly/transport component CsgG
VFKFVNVKDLAEFEAGMTRNEPTQLCVSEAIEAGVAHLIVRGIQDGNWALHDPASWSDPVVQRYAGDQDKRQPIRGPALADGANASPQPKPEGAP